MTVPGYFRGEFQPFVTYQPQEVVVDPLTSIAYQNTTKGPLQGLDPASNPAVWTNVGAYGVANVLSRPVRVLSDLLTARPRSIIEPLVTNVGAMANATGLSIAAGGGLVATTAGVSGTGEVTLPLTLNHGTKWRFAALQRITNPADTNYTNIGPNAAAADANPSYKGLNFGFNVGFMGGNVGATTIFQPMPAVVGDYWLVATSDGTRVTWTIIPANHAGLNGTTTTGQSEVYRTYDAALVSGGPAVNVFDGLTRITLTQRSAVNPIMGWYFSEGLSGSPDTTFQPPATVNTTIGADTTGLVRLPKSYNGKGPLDLIVMGHPNASDEYMGQRDNDPDLGAGIASLVNAGYAVASCRNGVDGSTYTSALSSDWGASTGLAGRKALIDWCAANVPGLRNCYWIGESMGLLDGLNFARLYPGVLKAIAGISGVTNLTDSYTNRGFGAVINTAYTTTAIAKVQDNDPNLHPEVYKSMPLKLWHGDATDTTVPAAQNALLFKTNVEAQGGSVPVTTVAGAGHLTAAALWDGPALAAFFTANA